MNDFMPAAIPFAFPGIPGVRCLFSTRHAGDMLLSGDDAEAAKANRKRFMDSAGFAVWAETRQVHRDALVRAAGGALPYGNEVEEADGLFTVDKGVGLIVKTADCQPLLIAREDGGAVAGLHVGWRGNAMRFPVTALARLCREFDCESRHLAVVRGPSLGPTAAEFVNFKQEWPSGFTPWFDRPTRTMNLWALTRSQLERAGVRADRIFSLDLCTRDMPELFFSHRRQDAGRQVNVVWIAG